MGNYYSMSDSHLTSECLFIKLLIYTFEVNRRVEMLITCWLGFKIKNPSKEGYK